LSPSREEEEVDQLQAQLPDVLQALVSGYVPDAIITTTADPVERGVTVAELMVLLHDGNEQITTLVAVRPLRLTAVRLPYVRRLEGPVFLYGDCKGMFQNNHELALQLDTVDTRAVTSMHNMFFQSSFNGDLRSWDTANVTDMSGMFECARRFDRVLPAWDTGRVTDMSYMFAFASGFNQVLPAWDTGRVTNMSCMFRDTTSFNQALPAWDTGRVKNMSGMFLSAISFNQILPAWDTANVTDMSYMFAFADDFDQGLPTTWDTGRVANMSYFLNHL
jgi:surface protein